MKSPSTNQHLKLKSRWKNVKVNPKLNENGFLDIVELQVLNDYELVHDESRASKVNVITKKLKPKKVETKLKSKKKNVTLSDSDQNTSLRKTLKKKVKKKKKLPIDAETENELPKDEFTQTLSLATEKASDISFEYPSLIKQTPRVKSTDRKRKLDTSPKSPTRKKLKQESSSVYSCESDVHANSIDLKEVENGWKDLFVPFEVLEAFAEKGFGAPLPIQSLVLPHAIRDKMDIIGAAETGSGKTLAFGVPILSHIIELKRKSCSSADLPPSDGDIGDHSPTDVDIADLSPTVSHTENLSPTDDDIADILPTVGKVADLSQSDCEIESKLSDKTYCQESSGEMLRKTDVEDKDNCLEGDELQEFDCDLPPSEIKENFELEDGENGCVFAVDNVNFDWLDEKESDEVVSNKSSPLYAVILTPTRELAVQVKSHLANAARHTDIKVAVVVGGISMEKQQRLLKKCPEIIVATPGRLWELIQQGEPHLSKVQDIKFLVIDEADRMVEKGHFAELISFLELINADEENKKRRQNFVFSATLTLMHDIPDRISKKKKYKKIATSEDKLKSLMNVVGMKLKPKVIDLSKKIGIAQSLTETRIGCDLNEKDLYLYYVLQKYPGRTLIFTNTKDCVRRLVSIFDILQCSPFPLHSDMHQKQRLKNLDRFKGNSRGLLIATDVAARGLDIPGVEHVIHYQVPKTSENYVHRSGRTARASNEGLSVLMMCPQEIKDYRKLMHNLNKDGELPLFPIDVDYLMGLKERVSIAQDIDKQSHTVSKQKKQNGWFENLAKEADIDLDENLLYDLGNDFEKSQNRQKLDFNKQQLKFLLQSPVISGQYTGKYPTKSGSLEMPFDTNLGMIKAVELVKSVNGKKGKKNFGQNIKQNIKQKKKRKK